jgi:starch synthase (maltosyl-transferring)
VIIYNLFPLLAGPFSGWSGHFSRAAAMGFDHLFINPIQQPGMSGSLYAVRDYFRINPFFLDPTRKAAPEQQVRQMIDQAHAAGLKVMIDLVINHCAIDAPIVAQHPDWFVREPDGQVARAFCIRDGQKVVWGDLTHFDHRHSRDREGLYRYCLRAAEHLLGLGFDAFRCDAAYQIPPSFWSRLIAEIKSRHRSVSFVAETLGCTPSQTGETARAGFDYVFNSSKYWDFQSAWIVEQYDLLRETVPSISFPESHDTPRLCEELHGSVAGLKQRYLFSALFSSGVMIPVGFEYGFRKRLHVVQTVPADWEQTTVDLRSFIAKVNGIKRAYAVLHEESPIRLFPCHNPNILLMGKGWAGRRDQALLILNKDIWNHQEFTTDHFRHFLDSDAAPRDVSPEYALETVHEPFHYGLRPGQGIVLVTSKK